MAEPKKHRSGTRKKAPLLPSTPPMAVPDPKAPQQVGITTEVLKACSGSTSGAFGLKLLNDTIKTVSSFSMTDGRTPEQTASVITKATIAALRAFKPKDAIEGLLASQALALHEASMVCLRKAMNGQQTADTASKLRRDGVNLARGMSDMLAALDRKRGRGSQHIRVERVMVSEGGQAIVGNISGGSALPTRREEPMALDAMPADKVGVIG